MVKKNCPHKLNGMTVEQIKEALNPKTPKQLSLYFDIVFICSGCEGKCELKKPSFFAKEEIVDVQCPGCLEIQSLLLVNGLLLEGKRRFEQIDGEIYHKHLFKCKTYRRKKV